MKHIWIVEERYQTQFDDNAWRPMTNKYLKDDYFSTKKDAKRAILNMHYCAHDDDLRISKYVRVEK